MILAADVLPRILFGLAYGIFSLGEAGLIDPILIEFRGSLVRGFLALLLMSELLKYIVNWRKRGSP